MFIHGTISVHVISCIFGYFETSRGILFAIPQIVAFSKVINNIHITISPGQYIQHILSYENVTIRPTDETPELAEHP